jgi:CRP-like cAMP-binding protein
MASMVFLRSLELFKGLDETELALVQRCCGGGLAFSQGDRLFTEGEDAGAFFALVEGAVELRFELPGRPSEKARTVLSVGSGEILGWSAVVPPFRYTLSAICVSERCEVLRYHRGDFIQTLDQHPAIGYKVMKNITAMVARRFHALSEKFAGELGRDEIDGW